MGAVISRLAQAHPRARAFGEMVALLWAEGNRDAAIRLEELWNELAHEHTFALFCAYPLKEFAADPSGEPFGQVCTCHSRVLPAESYAALSSDVERLRAICGLQQKALALEAEIAHRQQVEHRLRELQEQQAAELSDLKRPHELSTAPPLADGNGRPGAAGRLPLRRVLVVDDNVDAAESFAMLLRMLGQDVHTAHDPQAALTTLQTYRPDVAFLDIGLPGMSGHELARHIRALPGGDRMLLVALTGWGREEDRQQSLEAGFNEHVTKPAELALLQELLLTARTQSTES
jgi:CheY-like chemotaxis protein